ncbi:MAG: cell division protein FtsQ/DivIB, partial [Planctomycetota bacterium]
MEMIRRVLDSRAVWLLLGAALCWSLCRMGLRQLGKDPRFLAWPREVHAAAPPWGGPELIEPVRRQLRRLGPVSLFDPRFAGRIRDALEEVAVVRTVGEVRRRWPNRYSVSLALHRPVAVVLFEGREVLVAEDRTVLPSGPYASAATGLLRIHGVRAPPAAPGRPWRSERLDRGLATLAQIADVRDRDLLPLGIS